MRVGLVRWGPALLLAVAGASWLLAGALAGGGGKASARQLPVPHPLVNQLACCLYAAGYTEDMNQAKAIAAVEAGGLTPSTPERSVDMRPRTHT